MGQERQVEQAFTENEASQEESKQNLLARDMRQIDELPPDLSHLALRLIGELSACVQRVSSDLAQAGGSRDLELARQRWAQQLRALADMAEDKRPNLLPSETPLHELPPYPRRAGTTQPITVTTRVPVASAATPDAAAEQTPQEMPINPPLAATYRWVPLTIREREVLRLEQRGYSPRRIALRLVISIETVYTHTRNIRRKQRAWEQAQQERQARLDAAK